VPKCFCSRGCVPLGKLTVPQTDPYKDLRGCFAVGVEDKREKGVEGWEGNGKGQREGMGWGGLRHSGVRKEGRKGGKSFLPTHF